MNGRTNTTKTQLSGSPIPLEPISDLTLAGRDQSVLITWTDPVDKMTNPGNELAVEWTRTVIIRKQGSEPLSYTDGIVVLESTVRDQYKYTAYTDNDLINDIEYYYAIYSVTTSGTYSEITINSVIPRYGFIYLGDSADGTIVAPTDDRFGDIGRTRESFANNFYMRSMSVLSHYDSDLLYSKMETYNTISGIDGRFYYDAISVSDENHMIYSGKWHIGDISKTECWDIDLVGTALQYGGIREGIAAKNDNYFVLGGGYAVRMDDTDNGYTPWSYDRDTLTASLLQRNAFRGVGSYNAMGNAGRYLVTMGTGTNGDPQWVCIDDDLVVSFIEDNTGYYRVLDYRIAVSIESTCVFFGQSTNNISVDQDLVVNKNCGTPLPHAVYYHDAIPVNGYAVIAGGLSDVYSNNANSFYDFSVMDSDFIITNRGVDKMKYRRWSLAIGIIDNKLIIASLFSDQLPESSEVNGTYSENDASAEVYTF